MDETCEVCGRISIKTCTGIPGTTIDKVCFRVKAGNDTTCYQVGYSRSQEALAAANARAEKEHETARGWSQKAAELQDAQCDLLRAEAMKWIGCPRCEFKVLHRDRQCSCVCHNTARRVDALASPAAGEEGKHG